MRIPVIGGTGVVGRHTVEALRTAGHDIILVARARGVNMLTGEGLDDALVGVDAVIDVTSVQAPDAQVTQNLFAAATRNLLAAEQRVQVRHHVLLSIIGVYHFPLTLRHQGRKLCAARP